MDDGYLFGCATDVTDGGVEIGNKRGWCWSNHIQQKYSQSFHILYNISSGHAYQPQVGVTGRTAHLVSAPGGGTTH